MSIILQIKNISKKYKSQEKFAIKDMNLELSKGEILGVLGPNGAGKSTLVKMILGVIKPSAGEINMIGKSPINFTNREKSQIGVFLGGKSNLIFHLSVMDSLSLYQSIYKVPKQKFEDNIKYYGGILQCLEYLDQRVATLSLGQKLRAELLCILIYEPQILILDEPTLGLDIEGKRQIRDMLHRLATKNQISIIITTHDVNDMERLCTRLILICNGEKVIEYSKEEFTQKIQSFTILTVTKEIKNKTASIIEQNKESYRYLIKNEDLETVKKELIQDNSVLIKESEAKLEDILYEYYR